jgi:hypothetical protein
MLARNASRRTASASPASPNTLWKSNRISASWSATFARRANQRPTCRRHCPMVLRQIGLIAITPPRQSGKPSRSTSPAPLTLIHLERVGNRIHLELRQSNFRDLKRAESDRERGAEPPARSPKASFRLPPTPLRAPGAQPTVAKLVAPRRRARVILGHFTLTGQTASSAGACQRHRSRGARCRRPPPARSGIWFSPSSRTSSDGLERF